MKSIIYQTTIRFREGMKWPVILFFLSILLLTGVGCKKMVEAEPPYTSLNGLNVYEDNVTATAVLTGIYTNMSQASFTGGGVFGGGGSITSMSLFPGLSADELTLFYQGSATYLNYYKNTLTSVSTGSTDFWTNFYKIIAVANAAVEGINKSSGLSPFAKKQLLGEAKFVRAFCYFYLVNLYGDVPLVISTNPQENRILARAPKDQIYGQIIEDLKDAVEQLNSSYVKNDLVSVTTERTRPNKSAAQALLARTYLFKGEYSNAETASGSVISNTATYDTVSMNNVFLKNSKEAIWQLQPVITNPSNTQDARLFVLPVSGPGSSYPVYLSNNIVNSFEAGDQRKSQWVGSVTPTPPGTNTFNYSYKYKNIGTTATVTEYLMVMRISEQYLIRAEARAQLNNISGAQSDLNIIRKRAGLSNTLASDKASLLTAIMQERKVELFTEWGHRWLDLKRTGTVDGVMTAIAPQKGTTWNTNFQLYPVPSTDIGADPNLTQNPGYQ
jgi:hypothetical protein